MKGLDLRAFKKVESDNQYTTLKHPSGHTIKVLHASLSPKHREDLKSLPLHTPKAKKMADGGEVEKPKKPGYGKSDPTGEIGDELGKHDKDNPKLLDLQKTWGVATNAKQPKKMAHGGEAEDTKQAAIDALAAVAGAPQPQSAAPPMPMMEAPQSPVGVPTGVTGSPTAVPAQSGPMGAPEGIQAPSASSAAEEAPYAPAATSSMTPEQFAASQAPPVAQAAMSPLGQQAAQPPQEAAAAPQSQPAAPAAPGMDAQSMLSSALSEGEQGLRMEQQAQSKLAKAQAAALNTNAIDQKTIADDFRRKQLEINGEIESVMKDYKAGHINPNQVWENKSVPSKIGTIIGILASGLGAAAAGQENMAMKVLNNEIDRDIEAQKANMSNKGNILNALSNKLGNLNAGAMMLKSIKLGVAEAEMQKALNLAKDPLAIAALHKGSSELRLKIAEQSTKLAQSLAKGMLTPAQKAVDTGFAKDYGDWQTMNKSQVEKNLNLMKGVRDTLMKRKDDLVGTSGRVTGRMPDMFRSNESITLRDNIRQAAQGALKATLGSQFTEREGVAIGERSYNEKLPPAENIKKIDSAIAELQGNVDNMNSRSDYYEQHGTLRGWVSPKVGAKENALTERAKERLKANPNDQAAKAYLKRISGE